MASLEPPRPARRVTTQSPPASESGSMIDHGSDAEGENDSALDSAFAAPTESTPLVGDIPARPGTSWAQARARSYSTRRKTVWWKRPSPLWLLPGHCIFNALNGWAYTVSVEAIGWMACHDVGLPETPQLLTFVPRAFSDEASVDPRPLSLSALSAELSFLSSHDTVPATTAPVSTSQAGSPSSEWLHRCRASSKVQKQTTSFVTAILITGGVLASLTSGVWGAYSDINGRRPVLAIAAVSEILSNSGYLLVASHPQQFGIKTLLSFVALSSAMCGGPSHTAIIYAYATDTTPDGSRASTFAIFDGAVSLGLVLGPLLGGLVLRWTGALFAPYYCIITLRVIYLCVLIPLLPESLSRDRIEGQKLRQAEDKAARKRKRAEENARWDEEGVPYRVRVLTRARRQLRKMMGPLTILLPRKVRGAGDGDEDLRPLVARQGVRVGGRDWNVSWIALAYFLGIVNPALTPFKIIYSKYRFEWGVEETAYWTAWNSLAKLVTLLLVIPFATTKLRPDPPQQDRTRPGLEGALNAAHPDDQNDPAESAFSIFSRAAEEQDRWDREEKRLKVENEAAFDLKIATISMLLALSGYLLMANPKATPATFLISTAVVQLSGGVVPALQSLALSCSSPRDAGKLLAGLSVLASGSMNVVGPALFGGLFARCVDARPELVWGAAAAWWIVALVPTRLVRIGHQPVRKGQQEDAA